MLITPNGENEVTFTICPEKPRSKSFKLDFTSFSTQLNLDILTIYNADNADDPTTIIQEYSGTDPADSPGLVAATTTNASGCLTLVFTSNGFGVESGWQANISCQIHQGVSNRFSRLDHVSLPTLMVTSLSS
jgi:hypothetical protein